jgi:hypothetical protein
MSDTTRPEPVPPRSSLKAVSANGAGVSTRLTGARQDVCLCRNRPGGCEAVPLREAPAHTAADHPVVGRGIPEVPVGDASPTSRIRQRDRGRPRVGVQGHPIGRPRTGVVGQAVATSSEERNGSAERGCVAAESLSCPPLTARSTAHRRPPPAQAVDDNASWRAMMCHRSGSKPMPRWVLLTSMLVAPGSRSTQDVQGTIWSALL